MRTAERECLPEIGVSRKSFVRNELVQPSFFPYFLHLSGSATSLHFPKSHVRSRRPENIDCAGSAVLGAQWTPWLWFEVEACGGPPIVRAGPSFSLHRDTLLPGSG